MNARTINSRLIAKALDNAYHSLLPKTGYPLALLNIRLAAEDIDVNVHPQKSEIKFKDEGRIFKAVYHAIHDALATPAADQVAAAAPQWRQPSPPPYRPPPGASEPVRLWREEVMPITAARNTTQARNRADRIHGQCPAGPNREIRTRYL